MATGSMDEAETGTDAAARKEQTHHQSGSRGLLRRILDYFKISQAKSGVDTEYVRGVNYKYISTGIESNSEELVRCDLCGQQFKAHKMPAAVSHVAMHDSDGAAEIDPFKPSPDESLWEISPDEYESLWEL